MTSQSLKRRLDALERASGAGNMLLVVEAHDDWRGDDLDALIAEHSEGVGLTVVVRKFAGEPAPPRFISKQAMA